MNVYAEEPAIPSWIKNVAQFWVNGQISDKEFLAALQFLVDKEILVIPQSQLSKPPLNQKNEENVNQTSPSLEDTSVVINGIKYELLSIERPEKSYCSDNLEGGWYQIFKIKFTNVSKENKIVTSQDMVVIDKNGAKYKENFQYCSLRDGWIAVRHDSPVYEEIAPNLWITEDIIFYLPYSETDYYLDVKGELRVSFSTS